MLFYVNSRNLKRVSNSHFSSFSSKFNVKSKLNPVLWTTDSFLLLTANSLPFIVYVYVQGYWIYYYYFQIEYIILDWIYYFDLAETLVHSTLEPCDDADFSFPVNFNLQKHTVYVRCRPHLKDFLERVSSLFEIIIFTASQSIYAEQLLNVLDPKRKLFRHRVYRESCVFVEGNYLKDLSVLGRDLAHVVIVDNSPQVLFEFLLLKNFIWILILVDILFLK